MAGLPAGCGVDIEFIAGTWTDVTAYVESYSFDVGRTSPQSLPQTGQATVVLDNTTGNFTPGALYNLVGGTVAAYPNEVTGKRMRIRWTAGTRFIGRILSYQPTQRNTQDSIVTITANDGLEVTAGTTLLGNIAQAIMALKPVYYWPLNDATGALSAEDAVASADLPDDIAPSANAVLPIFGAVGVSPDDGTSVQFAPTDGYSTYNGMVRLFGNSYGPNSLPCTAFSWVVWVNAGKSKSTWMIADGYEGVGTVIMSTNGQNNSPGTPNAMAWAITSGGTPIFEVYGNSSGTTAMTLSPGDGGQAANWPSLLDGKWHCLIGAIDATGKVTASVDGYTATKTPAPTLTWSATGIDSIELSRSVLNPAGGGYSGLLAHTAVWSKSLTAAQIATIYAAGLGNAGETVDQRIARILGYLGVAAGEQALDASTVVLGDSPQAGRTAQDVITDAITSENGGAAFAYLNGAATFKGRAYRQTQTAPSFTIDLEADSTSDGVVPTLAADGLVNRVTVQRSNRAGLASTTVRESVASQNTYGVRPGDTVATVQTSKLDRANVAAWLLAAQAYPSLRFPQVTVDAYTAQNVTPAQLCAATIGTRIRVSNIPPALMPFSQADMFIEGWHEAATVDGVTIAFDVSPANNPAGAVWDDAATTEWNTIAGSWSLDSLISAAAASAQFDSLPSPSGGYEPAPAVGSLWQIDAEIVLVTSVAGAGGAWVVGLTRAQQGSRATAHAGGVAVNPWPGSTWSL